MGNVFHLSGNSEDAAAVIDTAIEFDSSHAVVHFAAAQIFAVLMQFNRSMEEYYKCLMIDNHFPLAVLQDAAVRCHYKLERSLEAQSE